MADVKLDIDVELKRMDKELKNLKKQFTAGGKKAGKSFGVEFTEGAKDAFKGFLGANIALTAISRLTSSLSASVTAVRDFDRALSEVNTILPETEKLTKKATKTFTDFSKTFATSQAFQAKSFYNIVSAGIKGTEKRFKVLNAVNKASIAGLTDIQSATKVVVASMNAYSRVGLTAAQASDALFVAVREGLTTFGELSATMGNVTPIASQVGVKFNDLAGAVAFITKAGVSTDTAVIQLRQTLASILKPSKEAADEARRIGLEFNSTSLKSKGFVKFMEDVRKKTGGSSDSLTKLFGNIRALSGVMSIVKGDFNDFKRIVGETNSATGATSKAFNIMKSSLDFRLKKLGNEFRIFGTIVASEALVPVEAFVKAIQSIRSGLKEVFRKSDTDRVEEYRKKIEETKATIKEFSEERDNLKQGKVGVITSLFGNAEKEIQELGTKIFEQKGLLLHYKNELMAVGNHGKNIADTSNSAALGVDNLTSSVGGAIDEFKRMSEEQWATLSEQFAKIGLTDLELLEFNQNKRLDLLDKARRSDLVKETEYQQTKTKLQNVFEDKRLDILNKKGIAMTAKLNAIIKDGIVNLISTSFTELGAAMVGAGKGFEHFAGVALGALGDIVTSMGRVVIDGALAMKALKATLTFSSFGIALAAGAGLLVLGGMLKGASEQVIANAQKDTPTEEGGLPQTQEEVLSAARERLAQRDSRNQVDLVADRLAQGITDTDRLFAPEQNTTISDTLAFNEPELEERQQQPVTNINIQGDVLDSQESGIRIVDLINQSLDINGTTIRSFA